MPLIAALSDDLSSNFAEAARMARDLEIDGLAVRNIGGEGVLALPAAALRRMSDTAARYELRISSVTTQIGRNLFLDSDDHTLPAQVADAARVARILGSSLVRVFATWIPDQDPVSRWTNRPSGVLPTAVVDRVRRMAETAENAGITLMVELEGASYVGTAEEARQLFAAVRSPALELCWDVCNAWWSGESPWKQSWPIVRELPLADVQLKDVRRDEADPRRAGLEQVALGTGDIPYRDLVSALIANGYAGWLTAERVFHPRRPEDHPALRAAMVSDVLALKTIAAEAVSLTREDR